MFPVQSPEQLRVLGLSKQETSKPLPYAFSLTLHKPQLLFLYCLNMRSEWSGTQNLYHLFKLILVGFSKAFNKQQ